MRRWFIWLARTVAMIAVIVAITAWLLIAWPMRVTHPALKLANGTLAIEHARIYTSPTAAPVLDGTVVIIDGRISAVGPNPEIPAGATRLNCDHCVVTAGFWNAHVHFTEPKWSMANWQSAQKLDAQLADMLTSRGFTTVVDTGSNPIDTIPLRRRIESGELSGPFIYTAGPALYPPRSR